MKLSATEPYLHPGVSLKNTSFGRYTEVGADSTLLNSALGDYSYCSRLCDIANTTVGKFSNIASMCRIGPTDHPIEHAALHHFHYRSSYYWEDAEDDAEFFAAREARRTHLGHDTWLGHGVIVKPEVTMGIGSIAASGAVVTKDVSPFMIVAGCPAKPVRMRFSEQVGERLLALAWWDWSHERLREALPDFRRMKAEAFLEKYDG